MLVEMLLTQGGVAPTAVGVLVVDEPGEAAGDKDFDRSFALRTSLDESEGTDGSCSGKCGRRKLAGPEAIGTAGCKKRCA